MCINVYNNMIGHPRSSSDRIGSDLLIYFDVFVDGQIIYLMILNNLYCIKVINVSLKSVTNNFLMIICTNKINFYRKSYELICLISFFVTVTFVRLFYPFYYKKRILYRFSFLLSLNFKCISISF